MNFWIIKTNHKFIETALLIECQKPVKPLIQKWKNKLEPWEDLINSSAWMLPAWALLTWRIEWLTIKSKFLTTTESLWIKLLKIFFKPKFWNSLDLKLRKNSFLEVQWFKEQWINLLGSKSLKNMIEERKSLNTKREWESYKMRFEV